MKLRYVVFALPVLVFLILRIGFDFNGLYGQDGHEYLRYSKALFQYFKSGEHPGDYFWPVLYPLLGAIVSFLLTPSLALQLLSVFSFSGSIYFIRKSVLHIYPDAKHVDIFLLITCVLSPQLILFSTLVMADMLTLFFIAAAFYFYLKLDGKFLLGRFLLFTLFCCAAFMTRYAAAMVLIVPVLVVLRNLFTQKKYGGILPAALVAGACFLPHFLIRGMNSTEFMGHEWLKSWSPVNFFRNEFTTPDGYTHYPVPNIIYGFYNVLHPACLFFGWALLLFLRRGNFSNHFFKLSLSVTLLYSLFLAGIPFQNKRFLMSSIPFLMVVLYLGCERALAFFKNKYRLAVVLTGVFLTQIFISGFYLEKVLTRNRLEKNVADAVQKYPTKIVYAFDVDISIRSYGVPNKIINLWKAPIADFEEGSLVIFNESALSDQWKNTNAMTNWERLKLQNDLLILEEFPLGWKLYEIGGSR